MFPLILATYLSLAPADQAVIQRALRHFIDQQARRPTPEMQKAKDMLGHDVTIDSRTTPFIGMVLSWDSNDPEACALMQRIAPTAVCMK